MDQHWRLSQVVFELHPSFTVPVRSIESQPYELTESGWGEFEVNVKVCAQDTGPPLGTGDGM